MNSSRLKSLWQLTEGHRLRYGAGIAAIGVWSFLSLVNPVVWGAALDSLYPAGAPAWLADPADALGVGPLLLAAIATVLVTTVSGVFMYLKSWWSATASEGIVRDLRDRLYSHLESLPAAWHDRAETGDLVQRCSSDVETVRVFLSGQIVEIGRSVLLVLCVVPIMISLNASLTLVSVALMPPIIAFALIFFRKVQRRFREMDEAEGRMTSVLQENLTGIRVVRAFARQDFESRKFGERNAEFRDRGRRLLDVLANYWALSDILCLGQIGLTLTVGAYWLLNGAITVGTLFTFSTFIWIVIWPVRHFGRVLADTGKALVSLDRIGEILRTEPEPHLDQVRREAGAEPGRLAGRIEFDRVTFAFDGGEPVLKDVSFEIRPGQTLAVLGPQGSGKSTIVHLLLRLYDYTDGSIRLDRHELRELSRRFVRSRIGVVLQEPFLYSKTVEENLRVGRAGAELEELASAAAEACVAESIESFEKGYDTMVGERGVTLSGGQRQRVALARALLKDPDVLILDDALSAVDTTTEADILDALRSRHGRATTIVIAHRLSTVVHADRILVLEHGRIEQQGTHAELVGSEGPYARLWKIQGALEDELEQDLRLAGSRGEKR